MGNDSLLSYTSPIPGKYILRTTGEVVEVIDYDSNCRGDRTDRDWVTYISSTGEEHLRAKLNFHLDFKSTVKPITDIINNATTNPLPPIENQRIYEVAKELVVNGKSVAKAVEIAKQLVALVGTK